MHRMESFKTTPTSTSHVSCLHIFFYTCGNFQECSH